MKRTLLALGLAALAFGAVACSDQTIHAIEDGYGAGDPRIVVDPEVLDFGSLAREEEVTLHFLVMNEGGGDLIVDGITLSENADGFTLLNGTDGFTIPPGASEQIEVSWTPYGTNQEALAIIESNDEQVPKALVTLRGEGLVPELEIGPNPYDYGSTYVGCDGEQVFALTNIGTDALDVTAVDGPTAGTWELYNGNSLPVTLNPGESIDVTMWFAPDDQTSYEGGFSVTSTEPKGTRTAELTGEGKFTHEYEDTWSVPYDPPADIMFLVDQSCSMDDDQARLANNFDYFINNLSSYTSSWKVMVVNDDDGCHDRVHGILTASTPNYTNRFNDAVREGGGNYTESLLTVAALATEKGGSAGCNAGFLREGALLHIIAVSDEPEQSPSSWSALVDRIVAAKGSKSLVKVSAIAGDYPSGCGSNDAGTGYYEASNYTGGEFLSICASSWSSYMTQLAEASISLDTFELTATAVDHTIRVWVNDTERTGGWSYDAAANTVVFANDIPEGGDNVKITYGGRANCD